MASINKNKIFLVIKSIDGKVLDSNNYQVSIISLLLAYILFLVQDFNQSCCFVYFAHTISGSIFDNNQNKHEKVLINREM